MIGQAVVLLVAGTLALLVVMVLLRSRPLHRGTIHVHLPPE